jgi:hypothetical protein
MDFTIAPEEWEPEMWREVFKAVVRFGAQPYEDLDDIVTAGWLLGEKRAELLDRPFWPGVDPQLPLMFLCWWPLKTAYPMHVRAGIISRRWTLVRGIHEHPDIERLSMVVPDQVLKMGTDDIYTMISKGELADFLIWQAEPDAAT